MLKCLVDLEPSQPIAVFVFVNTNLVPLPNDTHGNVFTALSPAWPPVSRRRPRPRALAPTRMPAKPSQVSSSHATRCKPHPRARLTTAFAPALRILSTPLASATPPMPMMLIPRSDPAEASSRLRSRNTLPRLRLCMWAPARPPMAVGRACSWSGLGFWATAEVGTSTICSAKTRPWPRVLVADRNETGCGAAASAGATASRARMTRSNWASWV